LSFKKDHRILAQTSGEECQLCMPSRLRRLPHAQGYDAKQGPRGKLSLLPRDRSQGKPDEMLELPQAKLLPWLSQANA